MLLAEEILLLLLDDDKGTMPGSASMAVDTVIGGALLCELMLAERIEAVPKKPGGKPDRLAVLSTAATGDELLDGALQRVAAREGRPMTEALAAAGKKAKKQLIARLVESGSLQDKRNRILGIFPSRTLPTGDARAEKEVRARVGAVLAGHRTPDPRSGTVIALLLSAQVLEVAFPSPDRAARKEQKARAEKVATGSWASEATRVAVQNTQAVIAVAFMVPTIVTSASS